MIIIILVLHDDSLPKPSYPKELGNSFVSKIESLDNVNYENGNRDQDYKPKENKKPSQN